MGTISTMALLQNIIDTEVNAKRYAESNALIKEPFEVCPPNRVAAMHRTVALQESLRAEGALRDHTARNLSYYGPSGVGQTPVANGDFPERDPMWQPAANSSREALMEAYHTCPFYEVLEPRRSDEPAKHSGTMESTSSSSCSCQRLSRQSTARHDRKAIDKPGSATRSKQQV